MGAQCAPLRKKKISAVPIFRSGRRSLVCVRLSKGKGEIHKRVENRRLSTLLCARAASARSSGLQLMQQFSFLLHYAIIKTRG